ncbi:MAG: M4 family metallopeptidase [Deltaproteobacteria bacterium]|nr:M4 family metallopeptidase [Deltaproteobacteria bacterium]
MRRLVWLALVLVAAPVTAAPPAPPIRVNPLARQSSATQLGAPLDARAAALEARLRAVLAQRPAPDPALRRQADAAAALVRGSGGTAEIHLRQPAGTPRQIRGALLQRAGGIGAGADEHTARSFLRAQRALLRLDAPDDELALERTDRDRLGFRHLRFAQRHGGLPVWPAHVIVHLDRGGDVYGLDGAYVPTPRGMPAAPALDAAAAIAIARGALDGGAGAVAGDPELIIYAPGDRSPRLAWRLRLGVSLAQRWLVVVDALDGAVLTQFNEIADVNVAGSGVDPLGIERPLNVWGENGGFSLTDTSKPMYDPTSDPPNPDTTRGGIVVLDALNQPPNDNPVNIPDLFFIEAATPDGFTVADGVGAAFGLSLTYDYYLQHHQRDSLDGAGGGLLAIVRLGSGFANAFWSGSYMAFGDADRYAGALDVVGHELTHGVTQYTANLVYRNESGAMNEAMSDIFGEAVEAFGNGQNDWLIGSDLVQPIRDMANPERFGDPSTYGRFVVTSRDNGGVHTNSGIINHAFYQLVEGLPAAIGLADAERIFYRALSVHLVANSEFVDARLACVAAARELFGPGSPQALATAAAFDAVEIFGDDPTPPPPPFPGVDGPDSTLFLAFDDGAAAYRLARRETELGDPADGVFLVDGAAAAARPSVSGDGSFAAYVDINQDACLVQTDGSPIDPESPTPEVCLGFPGQVHSIAVAPDGTRFGFVLLGDDGQPQDTLTVIDLAPGGETRTYDLVAPVLDGGALDTILYADTMDFSADGAFLIYDALNALDLFDGSTVEAWSIFALDLASGESQAIVPPRIGFDIGYPALGQRSDTRIVFDVFDTAAGTSTVTSADLIRGEFHAIGTVADGFGVPGFSGDDTAIVYSQPGDGPSGFGLVRQPLAADAVTPQGAATPWLADGDYGVIYRRGDYVGPGGCAGDCNGDGQITIDELVRGVSIALGSSAASACPALDTNGDGEIAINELIGAVNAALDGC